MTKPWSDPFGRRIKEIREEKGLSLRDVSARCNLSRTTISNYERGVHLMSMDNFYKVIDALEVTKSEFMQGVWIE